MASPAELLKTRVKKPFFRSLSAAIGSASVSGICGVVDLAVVGRYEGTNGAIIVSAAGAFINCT